MQRFEGQKQSINHYGRPHDQDSEQNPEFQSLSVNSADNDIDLFGDDDDEEESELTKQRLAAYVEKKATSKETKAEKIKTFREICF